MQKISYWRGVSDLKIKDSLKIILNHILNFEQLLGVGSH